MDAGEPTPLLLAIGLGIGVGVLAGSWIMSATVKLLMVAMKIVLAVAVVLAGIWLWREYEESRGHGYMPPRYEYRSYETSGQSVPYRPENGGRYARWWEE